MRNTILDVEMYAIYCHFYERRLIFIDSIENERRIFIVVVVEMFVSTIFFPLHYEWNSLEQNAAFIRNNCSNNKIRRFRKFISINNRSVWSGFSVVMGNLINKLSHSRKKSAQKHPIVKQCAPLWEANKNGNSVNSFCLALDNYCLCCNINKTKN